MGSHSRRKGKDGENELVNRLRKLLPRLADKFMRGAPMQAADPTAAPDVIAPGLWIECKRGKRPVAIAALRQAEAATSGGLVPVAITRADRDAWVVTMHLDDWVEMYDAWETGR